MRALLAAALLLLPRGAAACAVCVGGADGQSGLSNGIWWGIMVLLVATMSMVGSIFWLLWRVEKRRAAAEAAG